MEGAVRLFFIALFVGGYRAFRVVLLGGGWYYGARCGAWYLNLNNTSSNRNRNISSHLLYVHIKRKIVKVCYTMTLIYISEI